jgi:hypothetical protein
LDFMHELFGRLRDHPDLFAALALFSIIAFFGTLLLLPVLILYIPENYFLDHRSGAGSAPRGSVKAAFFFLGKNVLGVVFLLAGFAMLFLPGQGLLTMLIGLVLVDFPGKRKLEKRLIRNKMLFKAVNLIREKGKKPPLNL